MDTVDELVEARALAVGQRARDLVAAARVDIHCGLGGRLCRSRSGRKLWRSVGSKGVEVRGTRENQRGGRSGSAGPKVAASHR